MRVAIAVAIALGLTSLVNADPAQAAIKRATGIPAQPLGSALQTLATNRSFQVVYLAEVVEKIQSQGAVGELTVDEALTMVLSGTGLIHKYLSEDTVAITLALPTQSKTGTDARGNPAQNPPKAADREQSSRGWTQVETASDSTNSQNTENKRSNRNAEETPSGVSENKTQGLEEIVVTAQKRSQAVKDVPISITVFDEQELEARRVVDIDDYVLSIPNATIVRSAQGNPAISLRGVNASLQGGQFEPIAVTIDDMSVGATDSRSVFFAQAFDIERIEVLRGPQGTLTGANSLGGTINVITVKPDVNAFEMKGLVDYSSYNTMLLKGTINSPLSDSVALRTVVYQERSDGAVKNIGPAGGGSGFNNYGARLAARWLAQDNLTVDATLHYGRQDRGAASAMAIDRIQGSGRAGRIAAMGNLGGDYFDVDFIEDVGMNGGVVRYDVAERNQMENWMASLRAVYDLGRHTVDFLYGRYQFDSSAAIDNDFSEYATSGISRVRVDTRGVRTNTAELRMSSNYQGAFNWVAGVSYLDEVFADHGLSDRGDDMYAGNYHFGIEFANRRALTSSALFGNLFWDLSDRLHVSAGVRAANVETKFGNVLRASESTPLGPIELRAAELTEVNPRVALNFDLTRDVTMYVQYATGYRPGYGNNADSVGLHQTTLGQFDVPAEVDAETVDNYEIGLKGSLLNRRITFAAAVFYMDYSNLQAFGGNVLDQPSGEIFGFDINAGSARTQGFELEAAVRPTQHLQLRTAVGYVDAKVKELLLNGQMIKDAEVPAVRPWTGTLTGIYEYPVGADRSFYLRADLMRQLQAFSRFDKDPTSELPDFTRLDFSVGVTGSRWGVSVYMENVFDEVYWIGSSATTNGLHGARANFIPRTFGMRVTGQFGSAL